MRFLPILLIGALLTVVIAGCGSSTKEEENATTTAVTKTVYIQAGDAICEKANSALEKAQAQLSPQSQLEDCVSNTLVPNIQGQIDKLEALPAPSEDAEQLNALYDTLQADLDEISANPSSIQDDNVFADANALAQDYGFIVCGQD